jgi:hypothetical protein
MSALEKIDRRLFLRGLTLTSAGLIVPRPIVSIPASFSYDWPGILDPSDPAHYAFPLFPPDPDFIAAAKFVQRLIDENPVPCPTLGSLYRTLE